MSSTEVLMRQENRVPLLTLDWIWEHRDKPRGPLTTLECGRCQR